MADVLIDVWKGQPGSLITQAVNAFEVTPSDSTKLPKTAKALLLDADGDVTVTLLGMADATHITLPLVRGYNPLLVKQVWVLGTDAVGIFALL